MSYYQTPVGFGIPAGAASAMIHIGPRYPTDIALLIVPTNYGVQTQDLVRVLNTAGTIAFKVSAAGVTTVTNLVAVDLDLGGVDYTWPAADGSANQILKTNGSGVLDWTNLEGGIAYVWPADNGNANEYLRGNGSGTLSWVHPFNEIDYSWPAASGAAGTYMKSVAPASMGWRTITAEEIVAGSIQVTVAASSPTGSVDNDLDIVGVGGGPIAGTNVTIKGWAKVNNGGAVGYVPIFGA